MNKLFLFLVTGIVSLILISCDQNETIIGVKAYDLNDSFESTIDRWVGLGINTAFISKEIAYNSEFTKKAQENNIELFVIFPIFYNPEITAQDSSLFAINDKGFIAKESWVEFICPSRIDYQNMMIEKAIKLVKEVNPEGISIDFIRHFAYWEMIGPDHNPDSIPEACFCHHCIESFLTDIGPSIPHELEGIEENARWIDQHMRNEWTTWKSTLITSFVANFTKEIKKVNPDIKFNVHAVPWRQSDYNDAAKNIIGQNLLELSKYVDYISPMTYSFMLYRSPDWIHSVVNDFKNQGIENILPSIQVKECYRKDVFPLQEFNECIEAAIKAPSKGIIYWSWDYIDQEPEKEQSIKMIMENL